MVRLIELARDLVIFLAVLCLSPIIYVLMFVLYRFFGDSTCPGISEYYSDLFSWFKRELWGKR